MTAKLTTANGSALVKLMSSIRNANGASTESWVVTPDWLHQQRAQSETAANLVIVDCRFALTDPDSGRQLYTTAHIPTAHYLDLNQDLSGPVQQHGGRHPLPDPAKLAKTLTAIGVRSGINPTRVIAYDDSRFAFAARLWWLLRYLGHEQVAVLEGGFSHWQDAGYPVTSELPIAQQGNFTYQLRSDWVVDIAAIKAANRSEQVLIDSREPERYRGEREPIDPVAGHIPGAINYPWQGVTDAAGRVSLVDQQQRWADLPSDAEIVVYCGSGVTACVNLLSLSLAGIDQSKLYPGSWSDWCSYL
jgi:thiosulfate/3-mercaptopyruvate sulfurtransferase